MSNNLGENADCLLFSQRYSDNPIPESMRLEYLSAACASFAPYLARKHQQFEQQEANIE